MSTNGGIVQDIQRADQAVAQSPDYQTKMSFGELLANIGNDLLSTGVKAYQQYSKSSGSGSKQKDYQPLIQGYQNLLQQFNAKDMTDEELQLQTEQFESDVARLYSPSEMKAARDFTGYGKISDSFQNIRQVAVDTLEAQNKAYIEAGLATGASTVDEARERGRTMEKSFLDMQSVLNTSSGIQDPQQRLQYQADNRKDFLTAIYNEAYLKFKQNPETLTQAGVNEVREAAINRLQQGGLDVSFAQNWVRQALKPFEDAAKANQKDAEAGAAEYKTLEETLNYRTQLAFMRQEFPVKYEDKETGKTVTGVVTGAQLDAVPAEVRQYIIDSNLINLPNALINGTAVELTEREKYISSKNLGKLVDTGNGSKMADGILADYLKDYSNATDKELKEKGIEFSSVDAVVGGYEQLSKEQLKRQADFGTNMIGALKDFSRGVNLTSDNEGVMLINPQGEPRYYRRDGNSFVDATDSNYLIPWGEQDQKNTVLKATGYARRAYAVLSKAVGPEKAREYFNSTVVLGSNAVRTAMDMRRTGNDTGVPTEMSEAEVPQALKLIEEASPAFRVGAGLKKDLTNLGKGALAGTAYFGGGAILGAGTAAAATVAGIAGTAGGYSLPSIMDWWQDKETDPAEVQKSALQSVASRYGEDVAKDVAAEMGIPYGEGDFVEVPLGVFSTVPEGAEVEDYKLGQRLIKASSGDEVVAPFNGTVAAKMTDSKGVTMIVLRNNAEPEKYVSYRIPKGTSEVTTGTPVEAGTTLATLGGRGTFVLKTSVITGKGGRKRDVDPVTFLREPSV